MKIIEITSYGEFTKLQDEWNTLLSQCDNDSVFLRHEWFRVWWCNFSNKNKLLILLAKKNGRLIGIAPLIQSRCKFLGISFNSIEFMANTHSCRCDFIIIPNERINVLNKIENYLIKHRKNWKLLRFRDWSNDSRNKNYFKSLIENSVAITSDEGIMCSPYIRIRGEWKNYMSSLKSHFRSNLRRRERLLKQKGEVKIEVIKHSDSLESDLLEGFQIEYSGLKGNNGTAIIAEKHVYDFYNELAHMAQANGWLRLHFLKVNGQRIAFSYTLSYKKCIFLLKIGHLPKYARYSPGQILRMHEIKLAFQENYNLYDFLGFDMKWKYDWNPIIQTHQYLVIYKKHLFFLLYYFLLKKYRLIKKLSAD